MSAISNFVNKVKDALPVSPMLLYVMLLIGIALTIASMLVPYYSGTSGVFGIWTDTNKCLGQPVNSDECYTIEALPIVTIIMGFVAIILLAATHAGTDTFLDKVRDLESYAISPIINLFDKEIAGYSSTAVVIGLTALFSMITLITQLVVPVKPIGQSLEDQNKSGSIKYKDGLALSAAATAVLATSFLMMMTNVEGYIKKSG